MISSNITSSSSKVAETVSLARIQESRLAEAKQASVAKAEEAAAVSEPVDVAVETRKAVEKETAATEDSDQAMRQKVKEAVENVRNFIKKNQRTLDFEMAEESNRVIITVIDRETNKVIRQIPPEDVVNISDQIASGELSSTDGMLFKIKA